MVQEITVTGLICSDQLLLKWKKTLYPPLMVAELLYSKSNVFKQRRIMKIITFGGFMQTTLEIKVNLRSTIKLQPYGPIQMNGANIHTLSYS